MLSPYFQTNQVSPAWIWYMLLALVLLLLIFWWLNRRRDAWTEKPRENAATTESRGDHAADDLKRIEGIGPKVEKVLNEAGITTFASLARADAAEVKQKLNSAGLQMMNPEGWIEQAGLAAKGDWEALRQLQDELKGGRKE